MKLQTFLKKLSPLLAFLPNIFTSPTSSPSSLLRTIYQFPTTTWIENLAVRSNGHILATLTNIPSVYEIVPSSSSYPATASPLYTFPNATSLSGIDEISPDIFSVVVGNFSLSTFLPTPGSYSIWTIDFKSNSGSPKVKKVTDIPEAELLNGMTRLPTREDMVLVGDSVKGVIWRVDVRSGEYSIAIDVPEFHANASAPLKLGVNGIRWWKGFVYFVNVSASS